MRKITIAITIIEAFLIILIAAYFTAQHNPAVKDFNGKVEKPFPSLTGNTVINPPQPQNCSESSIKAVWDSVFKESSSNINISAAGSDSWRCNSFTAYKIKNNHELYLIIGMDTTLLNINITTFSAQYMNFTPNYLDPATFTLSQINPSNITKRNLSITDGLTSEFSAYFQASPTTWAVNINSNGTRYLFDDSNSSTANINISQTGGIEANYTVDFFMFVKTIYPAQSSSCTPNWTAYNTSCDSNENKLAYYVDSNNCQNVSTLPQNISLYCDYDNNGIIGSSSSINFIRVNPKVKINGSELNLSSSYSGMQNVEILDNNISLIEMQWDFSSPLSLSSIKIEKQNASASAGYVIINGLDRNKTVYINKISSSSSSICIRDSNITSIDSISQLCDAANEYRVLCPGSNQSFSCEITSDNRFKVSGIMHSAIRENLPVNFTPVCTPQTCSYLGKNCGSVRESSCNITLNCGSCESGFNCSDNICVQVQQCTPKWNCTSWKPSTCPKTGGNQTRTCKDDNKCGTSEGKPEEKKACSVETPKSSNSAVWIFVGALVLLALIAVAILFWMKHKSKSGNVSPVGGPGITFPPSTPPINPQTPIQPAQPYWMPQQPMPPIQPQTTLQKPVPYPVPSPAPNQAQLPAQQSNPPQNNSPAG